MTNWYKGNLHAHTTESDGDAPPEQVAAWYAGHGYDFLAISDHNTLTLLPEDATGPRPLMVPGEELTVQLEGQERAVYVNCVGNLKTIEPVNAGSVLSTIQANVDAVVAAGALAIAAAPFDRPGFDSSSMREIHGVGLMDVYNAHPMIVEGDPDEFSFEDLWDGLLTAGMTVFATATDDAHNFLEFGPDKANPGGAWIYLRADDLSVASVLSALTDGEFYSTTGLTLADVRRMPTSLEVSVEPSPAVSFTTKFIGPGGKVLDEQTGPQTSYRLSGDESYVRARVTSSDGSRAWTQPVMAA